MSSGIQYDERGRPYIDTPRGRNYISPAAFGTPTPEDTTGIFRKGPQWDQNKGEYETPLDWGNILSMITAGGLTAGVANAAMAGGAAGAGGGAGAAEATVPGIVGGSGGAGAAGAAGVEAFGPATGGLFASGTGPGMVAGSGLAGGAGNALTAANTGGTLLKAGKLLAGAAPVVGAMTAGNRGQLPPLGTGFQDFLKNNPQFSNLLNNQVNQSNRNDGLHKALVDLSMRLLPNSSRGAY